MTEMRDGGMPSKLNFDAIISPEQAQEKAPVTLESNTQPNLDVNKGAPPLRKVKKKIILKVELNVQLTDDAVRQILTIYAMTFISLFLFVFFSI
jgi:hypothetical protein